MDCKFVIGQRVVCTVKGPWEMIGSSNHNCPAYMSICKIADMHPVIKRDAETYTVAGGVWLYLEEYPGYWFSSTSFSPLKETKTDIGTFEKLLKTVKIKEDA